MNRSIRSKFLGVVLPLGALLAVVAPAGTALAQPAPPPPGYIASYEPVYYNGYAHYYYRDHWYYRDHYGGWQYYNREPAYFGAYRGHWGERYHHWR